MSSVRLLRVSVALAAIGAIALPASASAKPVITMSGSTSVAPLASLLARGYLKESKNAVKFKLAQGGSDVGVADVAAGRVSIGMSSRDPKSSDPGGIFFNKIAKDGICIITNPANPITNLSQAQIKAIFGGSVRDWKDVAGSGITGAIDVTVRTAASGTQDAFAKIFLGTTSVTGAASQKASNGLVQNAVKSNKNAVGYVSLDFVGGVNAAAYNGVACDLRNAKSGEYGGVRNFWMVTRGPATGNISKFIKWTQDSAAAAKITGTHWVPLK
jgi:phosphate transport system substrate-binding protein